MHKHYGWIHLLHRRPKPSQSVQPICQDSTHQSFEPYDSCKIFEQIVNNLSPTTATCFLRHSQHPSPPVKLSGLNVSKSHATQANKYHGSDVKSIPVSFKLQSLETLVGVLQAVKMRQPKTRVYEENDLQPGLNTSTLYSNI